MGAISAFFLIDASRPHQTGPNDSRIRTIFKQSGIFHYVPWRQLWRAISDKRWRATAEPVSWALFLLPSDVSRWPCKKLRNSENLDWGSGKRGNLVSYSLAREVILAPVQDSDVTHLSSCPLEKTEKGCETYTFSTSPDMDYLHWRYSWFFLSSIRSYIVQPPSAAKLLSENKKRKRSWTFIVWSCPYQNRIECRRRIHTPFGIIMVFRKSLGM